VAKILANHLTALSFAKIFKLMETTKSTGRLWLYFLVSLIVLVLFCVMAPKFFWVVLPFNFTIFAKAMNLL